MKKIYCLILRFETIFSALLAVLTSAIVTLCTLGMSKWTVLGIVCFFACIVFLIILIPISHSYQVFYRKRISNNEVECQHKAVEDAVNSHFHNNEDRGKAIIIGCFAGLIFALAGFLFCSLKCVTDNQHSLEKRLMNIERKLDGNVLNEDVQNRIQ